MLTYLCKGVEPVVSFAFTLAPACNSICINGIRPLLTCSAQGWCQCPCDETGDIMSAGDKYCTPPLSSFLELCSAGELHMQQYVQQIPKEQAQGCWC